MNQSVIDRLIFEFYKFVILERDYKKFVDQNGNLNFKKLMNSFKHIIINKIGRKEFVNILNGILNLNTKDIITESKKHVNNIEKSILMFERKKVKTLTDLTSFMYKLAYCDYRKCF